MCKKYFYFQSLNLKQINIVLKSFNYLCGVNSMGSLAVNDAACKVSFKYCSAEPFFCKNSFSLIEFLVDNAGIYGD